jgi:hypothetical protein
VNFPYPATTTAFCTDFCFLVFFGFVDESAPDPFVSFVGLALFFLFIAAAGPVLSFAASVDPSERVDVT